jgi:hypothetical protein
MPMRGGDDPYALYNVKRGEAIALLRTMRILWAEHRHDEFHVLWQSLDDEAKEIVFTVCFSLLLQATEMQIHVIEMMTGEEHGDVQD